jgi:lipopolysaccharide/colanic/teichoic acid biosynthesis glycosyltransferase
MEQRLSQDAEQQNKDYIKARRVLFWISIIGIIIFWLILVIVYVALYYAR